tara:strand:+ start:83 stop:775 length:693 start_codon:yes stop_codon:yes gene_type:complete
MRLHTERHFSGRIGWLRAAVLGANDGIISTSSLIMGVAVAGATQSTIMLTGFAGLVAGAMSMAAGEYVSVSSQSDTEKSDLARERLELENAPDHEHQELAKIYMQRGLEASLADQVASQLMRHDALAAHARDELGLTEMHAARPVQAALASATTFALGAALPLMIAQFVPRTIIAPSVSVGSLFFLSVLGGLSAYAGGSNRLLAAVRVTFWGALAMAITAAAGHWFGGAG